MSTLSGELLQTYYALHNNYVLNPTHEGFQFLWLVFELLEQKRTKDYAYLTGIQLKFDLSNSLPFVPEMQDTNQHFALVLDTLQCEDRIEFVEIVTGLSKYKMFDSETGTYFCIEDGQLYCRETVTQISVLHRYGYGWLLNQAALAANIVAFLVGVEAKTLVLNIDKAILTTPLKHNFSFLTVEPSPFPRLTIKDRNQKAIGDFLPEDFSLEYSNED